MKGVAVVAPEAVTDEEESTGEAPKARSGTLSGTTAAERGAEDGGGAVLLEKEAREECLTAPLGSEGMEERCPEV